MEKQHKKLKMSLKNFVAYGFTYIVGVTFLSQIAIYAQNTTNDDGTIASNGIGMYIILIFAIAGLMAYIVARAFGRLSTIFKTDQNGGAYIFARATFGKFVGILIMIINYTILPIYIVYQIDTLIKVSFSSEFSSSSSWWTGKWGGDWQNLYLDLISIAIYLCASLTIFLGAKIYKKILAISSIVQWIPPVLLLVGGIILAFNSGTGNWSAWANQSSPGNVSTNIRTYAGCFMAGFFYFSGFETFITAGKNIEKPEKNIPLGFIIIMGLEIVFYSFYFIIMFLALAPGNFVQNEYINFFDNGWWGVFKYIGVATMLFYAISMKINSSVQNALYGGTQLQPMSNEGFISRKFSSINNEDIAKKASWLNQMVVVGFVLVWLIIPDFIQAIMGKDKSVFDVRDITEATASYSIIIYIFVLICMITNIFRKNIKVSVFETMCYMFVLLLMCAIFVYHWIDVFEALIQNELVGYVEVISISLILIGFTTWYFTGFKHYYAKNIAPDKHIVEKIESQFVLIKQPAKNKIVK